MKIMSPDILQSFYIMSLEIGTSLDIKVMLARFLSSLKSELALSLAAVIDSRGNAPDQVLILSDDEEHKARYNEALIELRQRNKSLQKPLEADLPFTGKIGEDTFLHLIEIKSYGIIAMVKNGAPLSDEIIYCLPPLTDRLATACHSCAIREEHEKIENRLLSMKQSLDESIYTLEYFFENTPLVAIQGFDRDGEIVHWNRASCELYGYPAEEAIGKRIQDLVLPDEAAADFVTRLHEVWDEGKALSRHEWPVTNRQGEERYIYSSLLPLVKDGITREVFCIDIDMTERRRFEIELITAKEKAENMSRLKTAFLSNMSHEIRTPVHGITGFASILRESLKNPEHLEMIELIVKSTGRLMSTIDDILDFSRLESRNYTVISKPADIIKVTKAILEVLEPLAADKDLFLTFESATDSIIVEMDQQAYGKVLTNIVGNAIKFSYSGGVIVSIEHIEDRCRIRIKDTGAGIPSEYFETIFDEFRQISEGYSRSHEGSGLGLAITKNLVSLMGGKIFIEDSAKNQGTTFVVDLPLTAAHKVDAEPLPLKGETPKSQMARHRILFVEDDHVNMVLARKIFQMRDSYDVDFSTSAEESLVRASKNAYKVILLDIGLGEGMNGIELMKAIKEKTDNRNAVFVAVTGFAMKEQQQELKSLFDEYLSKPYEDDELFEILEKHCI